MKIRFDSNAETEHLEAISFYESQQKGLGGNYLNDFEQTLNSIISSPLRFRVLRSPDIRSVSLDKFPYKILFRIAIDEIQILAVAHKRRRPDYWLVRI